MKIETEEDKVLRRAKLAENLKKGRATVKANREAKSKVAPQPVAPAQRVRRPLFDLFGRKRPAAAILAQVVNPINKPIHVKPINTIPFNWWYAGMFGLAGLALLGGVLYATTRNMMGVLMLLFFAGLAFLCYWRASKNIPSVPTLTSEAPTMGKVNCLCIYSSRDAYKIRRAVKIQFEHRRDRNTVETDIANLHADDGFDLSVIGEHLMVALVSELKTAIPSNLDRWFIEDINQWMPVVFTDFRQDDNNGEWTDFELPDATYTDPARMAIPLNMSAVQAWRQLEAGLFEKLKPLIVLAANIVVLFFMFLLASDQAGG